MNESKGNCANFTDRHGQNIEIDKLNSGKYCITVSGRMTQKDLVADGVIAWLSNASHCERKRSAYKPFTKDSKVPHTWDDRLFLVRPCGLHPGTGKVYAPSVVHLVDGQLFIDMDLTKPLTFSKNGDIRQGPTQDPYEANLEWMPLPK